MKAKALLPLCMNKSISGAAVVSPMTSIVFYVTLRVSENGSLRDVHFASNFA
jgi:hypothetical protein